MVNTARFEIHVQTQFSAAHHLRGYPGDCEKTHGHNWTVDVFVECVRLDALGIGIDFRHVKTALKALLSQFDHADLNALAYFQTENPTSENIARHLYRELAKTLDIDGVRVARVGVNETQTCGVIYWED